MFLYVFVCFFCWCACSPNSRTDFHLEEGSELFLQLKGDMELPTGMFLFFYAFPHMSAYIRTGGWVGG